MNERLPKVRKRLSNKKWWVVKLIGMGDKREFHLKWWDWKYLRCSVHSTVSWVMCQEIRIKVHWTDFISILTFMTCDWWWDQQWTPIHVHATHKQQSFNGMNVTIHRLCDFVQPTKSPIIFCFHIAIDCSVSGLWCASKHTYTIWDLYHYRLTVTLTSSFAFYYKKKLFTSMSLHDLVSEKGFFAFKCSWANILSVANRQQTVSNIIPL